MPQKKLHPKLKMVINCATSVERVVEPFPGFEMYAQGNLRLITPDESRFSQCDNRRDRDPLC